MPGATRERKVHLSQLPFTIQRRRAAIRLSVFYPGGGYFYTGHPVLGLGDAVTEGLLLILFVGGLIDVLTGEKGSEGWTLVAILGAALFIEKAQTIYHAKHYVNEYIPVDKNFLPLTAPA